MARLIIVSGPGAGTDHRLEGRRNSIGRDPANTIVLNDSLVSKRHAEIIRDDDGGLRIVDVGSSNGTLVNDRQVVEHRLSHNDQIKLGDILLRFESEPDAEVIEEGAKTVLIDEAATCLAIPSDAVEAARSRDPEPPPAGAVPDSTIYISDDDGSATSAAIPPPAAKSPGADPGPRKQTRLPVMPILYLFIALMVIIGCLLTWKVVQRSQIAPAESASTVVPAVSVGGSEDLNLQVVPEERTGAVGEGAFGAGISTPVGEENLIAEPVETGTMVEEDPWGSSGSAGEQVVAPPAVSRPAATPPATGTTSPRTTTQRTRTPQTITPPPVSSSPPPARTTYTPPPARPREEPPATTRSTTTGSTTTAAPPPAAPAKPMAIVPDATHGVLHVITKPVGATIYINEEMVGKSNIKKRMSPGKYIIRLEHQGQSLTDDVKVKVLQVSTFYHDFVARDEDDEDDDEDEDEDDKDRKKKDDDDEDDEDDEDDDDDDEDDEDDDDDDDEDDDDDDDDDKKKKKGWKKKLKDIFG